MITVEEYAKRLGLKPPAHMPPDMVALWWSDLSFYQAPQWTEDDVARMREKRTD